MKERPILFSGPMVRAILDGRKTQTRRVLKPQPAFDADGSCWYPKRPKNMDNKRERGLCYSSASHLRKGLPIDFSPYGKIGDRLWVRETWGEIHHAGIRTVYRADGPVMQRFHPGEEIAMTWRPSIHMPRRASRLLLEIRAVRVERLQEINSREAHVEGLKAITKDGFTVKYGLPDRDGLPGTDNQGWEWQDWNTDPRVAFRRLWDSINAASAPWDSNPWVWVLEFKPCNL